MRKGRRSREPGHASPPPMGPLPRPGYRIALRCEVMLASPKPAKSCALPLLLPRIRRRPKMTAIPAQNTTLEIAKPSPPTWSVKTEMAAGLSTSGDDADADCAAEPRRTTAAVLRSCAHAAPEARLAFAGSIASGAAALLLNAACPRWQQDATNCQPSPGSCAQRFDTILNEVGRQ